MMERVKEGWERGRLREVATEIRETYEPNPGEHLRYIGLEHIEQQTLKLNGVGVSSTTQSTKKIFKPNDILFGSLRPYFRKVVKPKYSGVCSTDITVIRSKENCHQDFLFYFIANQDFIDFATNYSIGTRMPRANWKVLSQSEWLFPPILIQRKIAAILSAYDDLIENNTRRIQILEEMAQTIYKEWFVKFRFLGHKKVKMVDSELGPIPEGWGVKRFGDVRCIVMGQSPSSKFYNTNGEGLPFHQGVTDFGTRFPTHKTYCTVDKRLAEKGDVLVSVRAPVGRINIANTKIIVGRGLAALRHEGLLQSFLFYQLKNIFAEEDSMGSGSIFNAITKEDMSNIKFLVPNKSLDRNFNELIGSLDKQIEILQSQVENLKNTRDLLLPGLISGVIDVEKLNINTEALEQ